MYALFKVKDILRLENKYENDTVNKLSLTKNRVNSLVRFLFVPKKRSHKRIRCTQYSYAKENKKKNN